MESPFWNFYLFFFFGVMCSIHWYLTLLHPASAAGVIVLTSCVCVCVCMCVCLSVSLSWLNGLTYRLEFWPAGVT